MFWVPWLMGPNQPRNRPSLLFDRRSRRRLCTAHHHLALQLSMPPTIHHLPISNLPLLASSLLPALPLSYIISSDFLSGAPYLTPLSASRRPFPSHSSRPRASPPTYFDTPLGVPDPSLRFNQPRISCVNHSCNSLRHANRRASSSSFYQDDLRARIKSTTSAAHLLQRTLLLLQPPLFHSFHRGAR